MTCTDLIGGAAAAMTPIAFIKRRVRPPRQALMAFAAFAAFASPASASSAQPAAAAPQTHAERMHARAVESFRQGRFPEAYGRFIDLANAGHPASARYALWMCEQGPLLFGKDWDCAPHEAEDWARTAGVALPRITARQYMTPTRPAPPLRR